MIARAPLLAFAVAVLATPVAAQTSRLTLKGDSVAVYNLVGELRVEAGTESDVIVEIQRGVRIMPGVTIGVRDSLRGPTIERNVRIGSGAKVLGPITVGRRAHIGANAVVLDDVPAGATVAGVPARVIR